VSGRHPTRATLPAALLLLALSLPPLHARLEATLTGHMAAQLVLLAAAAALAATLPDLPLTSRPAACLAVFAAVTLAIHLPAALRFSLAHPWLHGIELVAVLASGTLLFGPLVGPKPGRRLPAAAALGYAMLAMVPGEATGAWMMQSNSPGWSEAGTVMMAGTLVIGAVALAAAWRWLAGEPRAAEPADG
jgi:cytochrome c oxidase assembly factor CtaG